MSKNKLIQVTAASSQYHAIATALTFGQDPAMIYFDQEKNEAAHYQLL